MSCYSIATRIFVVWANCFPVRVKTFSAHVKSKNEHDVREKRFNAHAILRYFLHAAIEKLHRQGARTDRHP